MRRILLLSILGLACATRKPRWVDASTPRASKDFSVALPAGWMRFKEEGYVSATRDGPLLQHIFIVRWQLGKPLPNTKKSIAAGMMAQEAAEVAADDLA